jgi:hypothetical protein
MDQIEMNSRKLLSQHTLKNGLVLEFWDLSRPMLGDRWQVVVEARVAVDVTSENLPAEMLSQANGIIKALGKETVFTKQETRNFVPDGEMPGLLAEIQEQLLSSLAAYLGHPEFGPRFIRKKFADYEKGRG